MKNIILFLKYCTDAAVETAQFEFIIIETVLKYTKLSEKNHYTFVLHAAKDGFFNTVRHTQSHVQPMLVHAIVGIQKFP